MRSRLVSRRTSLSNQIRGLLAEYGIVIAQGISNVRKCLPRILEDGESNLSMRARLAFDQAYQELAEIDEKIKLFTKELTKISETQEQCRLFKSAFGIGVMTATALYAAMGDPKYYKSGREFAAFLGLVPRQYSSGGKSTLRGISKRGDTQTRTLLVQGAQAALSKMHNREDQLSRWAIKLKDRRGHNIATVALANKLARICWSMAAHKREFKLKVA